MLRVLCICCGCAVNVLWLCCALCTHGCPGDACLRAVAVCCVLCMIICLTAGRMTDAALRGGLEMYVGSNMRDFRPPVSLG